MKFEKGDLVEIVRPSNITKYDNLDREWQKSQIAIVIDVNTAKDINLVKVCLDQKLAWLPAHWLRKIEE